MKINKCKWFILLLSMCLAISGCSNIPEKVHEREAYGKNGMVATANKQASEIGVQVLKDGGNAVDAAVAVGFALGVLEPNASGIGGGGFMLVKMADEKDGVFIDFREITPMEGTIAQYSLDDQGQVEKSENVIGPKSIGVPGEVKGLLTALESYGTKDREEIIRPSVDLAINGVTVSPKLAEIAQSKFDLIMNNDQTSQIYSTEGFPLMAGDIIKNPELASVLEDIIESGDQAFYNSQLTKDMVAELQALGGYISVEDFNNYQVQVLKPVLGSYRGYEIISSPPPSSGGSHVIEILNMIENYNVKEMGQYSPQTLHLWAEAYKKAYEDRNAYMGDQAFVEVPLEGIVSKSYAKDRIGDFQIDRLSEDKQLISPYPYESGSTTHYSIVDKDGNMVAVTKTINHFFGSGVTVNGILMNDEIADLSFDMASPNFIEPGKKPLSSMSPTFILKEGKAVCTLGTPGGKRIISTIPWIISQMVDFDMTIQEAIEAPRLNRYETGALKLEGRFDESIIRELEEIGYEIEIKKEYDLYFGGAQGVKIEDNYYHGGADSRRDGYAVGY